MMSILNNAVLGFSDGSPPEQPSSSSAWRTAPVPEI